MKNCTFYNNTSDTFFTTKPYQGSAGGLSIGYHYNYTTTSPNSVDVHIMNCEFISNIAAPPIRLRLTSTEILRRRIFPGGGALSVLVNINSSLNFVVNNTVFISNIAYTFGGGIYCLIQRGSIYQTYMFANNIFMNNTAPDESGISFINLLNRPIEFIVTNIFYNCTFIGNSAISDIAGAATVYSLYGLPNTMVTFKDCNFVNNSAQGYGGAVDIASYNFFENKEQAIPVEFTNWLVEC